jgi:hypothetical protein
MTASLPEPLPHDPEQRLALLGAVLADHVEAAVPGYVVQRVEAIIDAWGRLEPDDREAALAAARVAGRTVAAEVGRDLRAELGRPAPEQRATPLEITARLVMGPTAILRDHGIPPVVRDARAEALHPEDEYDLMPRALAELGDSELGSLQLAWGLAKHAALRTDR